MKDEESRRRTLATYLRYSHLGFQFFVAVGVFTAAGIWLDRRLGTVVLFTLLGLALGFSGGLYALYREVFLKTRPPAEPGSETAGGEPPGKNKSS